MQWADSSGEQTLQGEVDDGRRGGSNDGKWYCEPCWQKWESLSPEVKSGGGPGMTMPTPTSPSESHLSDMEQILTEGAKILDIQERRALEEQGSSAREPEPQAADDPEQEEQEQEQEEQQGQEEEEEEDDDDDEEDDEEDEDDEEEDDDEEDSDEEASDDDLPDLDDAAPEPAAEPEPAPDPAPEAVPEPAPERAVGSPRSPRSPVRFQCTRLQCTMHWKVRLHRFVTL